MERVKEEIPLDPGAAILRECGAGRVVASGKVTAWVRAEVPVVVIHQGCMADQEPEIPQVHEVVLAEARVELKAATAQECVVDSVAAHPVHEADQAVR